jgi:hypothetical protein
MTEIRDPTGRFTLGNAPLSPGRPRLPEWLKGHTDALLRLQVVAALEGRLVYPATDTEEETTERVAPKERIAAGERLLDRLLGKAPLAPEDAEQRTRIWEMLIAGDQAADKTEAEGED